MQLGPRSIGGIVIDSEGGLIGMPLLGPRHRVVVIPMATVERVATKLLAERLVNWCRVLRVVFGKAEHGPAQASAWQTMQRAHAIANGVYVAAVNRVGLERPRGAGADDPGIEFWGGSFVADPFGVVLAEASRGEEVLAATT